MGESGGGAADPLARAGAQLRAGYLASAIDDARSVEDDDPAGAAGIIVVAATHAMTNRSHTSRYGDDELRQLVTDRIDTLLATQDDRDLVVASIGARVTRRRPRRSVRQALRAADGLRSARAGLDLWRAGAVGRSMRRSLLVAATVLFALFALTKSEVLAVLAVWTALAWIITRVLPWPLQLVADHILNRWIDHSDLLEPAAPALEPSTVRLPRLGEAEGDDASTDRVFETVSIDGAVRLRRTLGLTYVVLMTLSPLVLLLLALPAVAAVWAVEGGAARLALAALAAGEVAAALLVWRRRARIRRGIARRIVPRVVPMAGYHRILRPIGHAITASKTGISARAHAEGRDLGVRLKVRRRRAPQAAALYLRSFADDSPVEARNMSTLHAAMLAARDWIEVHVVPDPAMPTSPRGVVCHPIPDDANWVRTVADLARTADLVFVGLAPTQGLLTELHLIRSLALVDRVALMSPFGRSLEWEDLADYLAVLGVEVDLASPPPGRPLAVVPGSPPTFFTTRTERPVLGRTIVALECAFRLLLERNGRSAVGLDATETPAEPPTELS